MHQQGTRLYYLSKFAADGIISLSVFLAVAYWRFEGWSIPPEVWAFGLLFTVVFWIFSYLRRDYMQKIPRDALDSLLSTVFTFILAYLFTLLGTTFLVPSHPSRLVIGLLGVIALPTTGVCRYCFNRFFFEIIISEPHRVLFLGAGSAGLEMAEEMEKLYGNQIRIVGFLDDAETDFAYPILGRLDELEEVCGDHKPDSLFISISSIEEEQLLGLMARARSVGLPVRVVSDVFDIVAQKVTGGSQEKLPVIDIEDTPVRNAQWFVKRSLDILGALTLLLLLSPLMGLTAVLIKLESEGPVFYTQERMRNRRETFQLVKFRTMYPNADDVKEKLMHKNHKEGPIFKIPDDPRLTRVGHWLRRFSLDELPQLFNVFKGDMSLIGPRPPTPDELEDYEPWMKKRLDGHAGMTGLWQVSGRSNLDFTDMCLLDIYYLENWSLWLDLKILLKTIPAVITGRGAY